MNWRFLHAKDLWDVGEEKELTTFWWSEEVVQAAKASSIFRSVSESRKSVDNLS